MNNNYLLDTSNQNCYIYTTDDLRIEVLGAVRIDTLDRMRVTVKIALFGGREKIR
ncbi:MAG TPA: hypothetical protein VK543_15350 [Puia sp.]|nr:hypothetical protein [Puia sp.]